jgi:hypothetical protein
MKIPSVLASVVLFASAALQAQPVTRLAAEWLAPLDSHPRRFALVDEADGSVRLAQASAEGKITWSPTVPTGMTEVSDVATGLYGMQGEILVIASANANRIGMVDVERAAPFFRVMMGSAIGLGPRGVAAVGSGTTARDLVIGSSENGIPPGRLESRANLSAVSSVLGAQSSNRIYRRLQPLTEPGSVSVVGFITAANAANTNTACGLVVRSGSEVVESFKHTLIGSPDFSTDIRSGYQPGKVFVLSHRRGLSQANLLEFSTPLTTASTLKSTSVSLPFASGSVVPVRGGGFGPVTDGFIVTAADGKEARWMRINATGDGLESTGQSFAPGAGKALAGLIPVAGSSLVVLEAKAAKAAADSYRCLQWRDSAWVETDAGKLPALASGPSAAATLLFYNQDPATDEGARVLGFQSAGQWTRRLSGNDPVPASVLVESLVSPAVGLSSAGSLPVTPAPGTGYVITNQVEPGLSIAALQGPAALLAPSLRVDPPSGTFSRTFQVTALYDERRHDLLFRQDGGLWKVWPGPIAVAWTTSLQFTLRSKSAGTHGPIVSRSYSLSPEVLGNFDSDNDGVPDYVELHFGLDPFAGADSDGDGVSDLDEILRGSSPTNPADFTELTANIAPGGGMSLVAIARDHAGAEIGNGEEMEARAVDGSLLARAPVIPLSPALPDGGTRGAVLRSSTAPPHHDLIALFTPLYFDMATGPRSGRETIGFVKSEPPPAFAPAHTPVGTSLATNAAAWVTAAVNAASSHPVASERKTIAPADSAVSVLLENLVHSALAQSRPPVDPPTGLGEFSFLPGRDFDRSRATLSPADHAFLRSAGFDFRRALGVANGARPALQVVAQNYYRAFAEGAAAAPGMVLPIDALRVVLRGGSATGGYATAVTNSQLNAARTAYQNALGSLNLCFRPREAWVIEIPASPIERGIYHRVPGGIPVVLLRADGERFTLEQGLGLRPGSRFNVTGYTDTAPDGPYPTIEPIAVSLAFEPVASDSDADGNLLDDEWERFFFGSTGRDAFSEPQGNGYRLLQYFLDGVDPRGGMVPTRPAVALGLQSPLIRPVSGTGVAYHLDFLFPSVYQSRFEFMVEASASLRPGSFTPVPGVQVSPIGGDELRAVIPAGAATGAAMFYRVALRLRDGS